jgi:hypothetical protein
LPNKIAVFPWMLQVLRPEPESPEGSTSESEAESNPKRNFQNTAASRESSEDSMKKAFLLIVVPALLAHLAFAQTAAESTNTDQTNIKGCLGGSDGKYTVVEDNTGQILKISTSSVDLNPHLGHDVTLIGQKAGDASSAAAANSFAVTELNMISEHCPAAAAAPAATVTRPAETAIPPTAAAAPAATASTPAETAITPAPVATEPAATVTPPAETVVAPAPVAAVPAATVATPAEPTVMPAPPAAESAATVTAPAETTVTPAPADTRPTRPSARRRLAATVAATATPPAATAATSSETGGTPPAAAITPVATDNPSSEPVSPPAAAATTTTPTATARGWSLWLWIAFAVLVVVIGTMFPFLSRWRKAKMLERTGAPNLSLTRDAKSDQGKSDPPEIRKAA